MEDVAAGERPWYFPTGALEVSAAERARSDGPADLDADEIVLAEFQDDVSPLAFDEVSREPEQTWAGLSDAPCQPDEAPADVVEAEVLLAPEAELFLAPEEVALFAEVITESGRPELRPSDTAEADRVSVACGAERVAEAVATAETASPLVDASHVAGGAPSAAAPVGRSTTTSREDAIDRLSRARERILTQLEQVIVGQKLVIEELLITLFSRGHCLLEGVPGLAKTLMISTLARTLNLSFSRIQFTPDLMPADITGIDIIEENRATGSREYRFLEGPLFSNVILADEINRTPPKTQAALLESMQERQVTVGRVRHGLADPFFVLATQNPIEQEGTYPLPEAQQDRFMFKVFVNYPSFDEEFEVARRTTALPTAQIEPVLTGGEIVRIQRLVREVPVSDHVIRYTLALVRQTRSDEPAAPEFVREQLSWGAGPRAVQFLILGAKARALLAGRAHVTCGDIASLAKPVLRHRLVLSFMAESEGITPDAVIERLIEMTPQREDDLTSNPRFRHMFAAS